MDPAGGRARARIVRTHRPPGRCDPLGHASTLLVSGEAGIGKTALVREAVAGWRGGTLIWAPCLPLRSLATPLLPLRSAFRSAGPAPDLDAADRITAFDSWMDAAAPVVLVVDDLQWADASTLDILMYVLAGPPDRPVGVVLTMRTGEATGDLRRWLADVRRLPRVRERTLDRLSRAGTRDQLTGLLGRVPDESLVDDVTGRTLGNPYLTSLLVRDLPPGADGLPPSMPTELRDALARTWHRLSPDARDLTSVLAVAGHPRGDFTTGQLPLLREAVDAGVLRVGATGRYWFYHPLLAEVLVGELLPERRRALHTEFATGPPPGPDPAAVIAHADHCHEAGLAEAAYEWAVRGARAAEEAGGSAEAVRLLRRALDWWPRVAAPAESRVDLLRRIQRVAHHGGRVADERAAVEELLSVLSPDTEMLTVVQLLRRRSGLSFVLGEPFRDADPALAAVRLAETQPSSPAHALATAFLAENRYYRGDPAAVEPAHRAVELAERSGSQEALGYALNARAQARLFQDGTPDPADAWAAWDIAVRLRHYPLFTDSVFAVESTLEVGDQSEFGDLFERAADELAAMGAPHVYISEMAAWAADHFLSVGDLPRARAALRRALGARPSVAADAVARLTAARLAIRQGRIDEAEAHFARATELIPAPAEIPVLPFPVTGIELAFARGESGEALARARVLLTAETRWDMEPAALPFACRALADQADSRRDRGLDPAEACIELRRLREAYPHVRADSTMRKSADERLVAAMQALADAETARGLADPGQHAAWREAADRCHRAVEPWHEAYCRWRQAAAGRGDREALRAAYRMASDLEAAPLLAEIGALATSARMNLTDDPVALSEETGVPGLTRREREILAYVVAGRSYAEIARALVLSEKTIAVHVSNMLRKTGTGNRVELAQLVHRVEGRSGR